MKGASEFFAVVGALAMMCLALTICISMFHSSFYAHGAPRLRILDIYDPWVLREVSILIMSPFLVIANLVVLEMRGKS